MQEYKYSEKRTRARSDDYVLVYLEKKQFIIVWKNNKPTYFIKVGKGNVLSCNCYHGIKYAEKGHIPSLAMKPCQHVQHAMGNLDFNKRKEVRSWINKINEEIAIGEITRHLSTYNR